MIVVSAAGLALMAAGPLAMSTVGAGEAPIMLPHLPAHESAAKPVRPTAAAPEVSVAASRAEAAFVAASLDDLMGGEFEAPLAEGEAAGAEAPAARGPAARAAGPAALARRIRVALFRQSPCPGEQQSLAIIGAATRGWEAEAAGAALRMVSSGDDLCPAVSAAVARSTIAAEAHMSEAAPLMAPAGGSTPGGSGGPGYAG
jgi:hypothetical protein